MNFMKLYHFMWSNNIYIQQISFRNINIPNQYIAIIGKHMTFTLPNQERINNSEDFFYAFIDMKDIHFLEIVKTRLELESFIQKFLK